MFGGDVPRSHRTVTLQWLPDHPRGLHCVLGNGAGGWTVMSANKGDGEPGDTPEKR